MTESPAPPGKARVEPCPDCHGTQGLPCHECRGQGQLLHRACPMCGDLAWDYVNGTDDRQGMACRAGCGYTWTAADPGWRGQVLPG